MTVKKTLLKQLTLGLFCLTVLGGCTTTFVEQILEKDYQSFYLRGVFTWWESDENYKVTLVEGKSYQASAKLIADGQPYDFKFADESYAPGYDCGSKTGTDGKVVVLNTPVQASCENPGGNFQFTPDETGTYNFLIDFTNEDMPTVTITKI